jgi:hypothetical protein
MRQIRKPESRNSKCGPAGWYGGPPLHDADYQMETNPFSIFPPVQVWGRLLKRAKEGGSAGCVKDGWDPISNEARKLLTVVKRYGTIYFWRQLFNSPGSYRSHRLHKGSVAVLDG